MIFLYNCKSAPDGAYRITKFDRDLNPESSYLCTLSVCECPAGHRPKCRHREMLPKFIQRDVVDTEWFFDYDRGGWVQMEQEPVQQYEEPEGLDEDVEGLASEALPDQPEQEPSPEQVTTAINTVLGGFPDHCLSSGECITPNDCILHGCAHGHGNPPRVMPAGIGQASEPTPSPKPELTFKTGDLKPSSSPTIRRRV